MCAEVCEPDSWENLFNASIFQKHLSPSIEGIDFPAVSIDMAYHDNEEGILHLSMLDGDRTKSNQETSFEVYNLPDSSLIKILCNGKDFSNF